MRNFDELNKKVWLTVKAMYAAELHHLGKELYSVGPVTSANTFKNLADRCQTVKTLMRLRPPSHAAWNKIAPAFSNLMTEVNVLTRALAEAA